MTSANAFYSLLKKANNDQKSFCTLFLERAGDIQATDRIRTLSIAKKNIIK